VVRNAWDEAVADDGQERARARDRFSRGDRRPHHQGRVLAVRLGHRAGQRVHQSLLARRRQTQPGAAVRWPTPRQGARARAQGDADRAAVRLAPPPAHVRPARARALDRGLRTRCRAARKDCSAPPPAAPRRTSSASPRSTPPWTAPSRSPRRTSRPRWRSGATAWTPPAGSSATASATPPLMRSGRSPRTDPTGSPAARCATSLAATRKPARSTAPSPCSKKPAASPAQAQPTAAAGPPSAGFHTPPDPTRHTPDPPRTGLGRSIAPDGEAVTERSEGKGAKRP